LLGPAKAELADPVAGMNGSDSFPWQVRVSVKSCDSEYLEL